MKQHCENPWCQNESINEVPVSVRKPADQIRALCAVCDEAYSWGVQHGRISSPHREVRVLAIADKGLIVHTRAYSSKKDAEKALVEYLRRYESYDGPDDSPAAYEWLAAHDERLSVDICSTPVDLS